MRKRDIDTLGLLFKRGKIGREAYEAGQQFADDFTDAKFTGISAVDYEKTSCGGQLSSTERAVLTGQRVSRALDSLGGMGSPCAKMSWDVIGLGIPVMQWADNEGYDRMEAKGILIASLNILARHYGFI